jgi:hypothetical protein
MAYVRFGKGFLEAGDIASKSCIACGEDCEIFEILNTGEDIELWAYCEDCDQETWHKIYKIGDKID